MHASTLFEMFLVENPALRMRVDAAAERLKQSIQSYGAGASIGGHVDRLVSALDGIDAAAKTLLGVFNRVGPSDRATLFADLEALLREMGSAVQNWRP